MEQLFGPLSAVLEALGGNAAVEEQLVFAAWRRVAGEQLSERALPLEFFENRLIVAVQNDTWRINVESFARELVSKLNSKLGDGRVRFIEFRVEPKLFKKEKITNDGHTVELPAALADAAKKITDIKLRETFLGAAAEHLGKPSDG